MSALHLRTYRIGSPRAPGEGLRVGVVRYLPRGVRKEDYARRGYFDVWFPLVAPSRALLSWIHARPGSDAAWAAFTRRYEREVRASADARRTLALLKAIAARTPIAIGCYCEDESRCHRSVLRRLIEEA